MNFIDKMVEHFIKLNRKMRRWQRVVSILGAVVVFVTTYTLVLPAITLDKETASTQAGMEIAASENEPSEDGTVFESQPEEEAAVEEETEADEEEASGTESGSQEAENTEEATSEEVTSEEASTTEETNSEEETTSEAAPATEGETTSEVAPASEEEADAENSEEAEAAVAGITENAAAAATTEVAPEVELITEQTQLVYDGGDYKVYADFGEDAKLPVGVELKVREITEESDPEAYQDYYEKALSQMQDKYAENTTVTFAKFYDISFVYEDAEVEPAGDVKVRIEYEEPVDLTSDSAVDTVHFDKEDEEKVEVIDTEVDSEKKVEEKVETEAVKAVEFESDQFSVYGVVGTETLVGGIVTADGSTYEVKVTYNADARIPKDSKLDLIEYAENSKEFLSAKEKVDAFKKAENETEASEAKPEEALETPGKKEGFSALGISIVDPNGNVIEPEGEVTVSIVMKSLPEGFKPEELISSMQVHHLNETEGDVTVEQVAGAFGDGSKIAADEKRASVEFVTDSFSTYTITWNNGGRSVILNFMDDHGNPITGITYNGVDIDGSSIALDDFVAAGSEFDLSQFEKDGKSLSNVHIGTYDDLSGRENTNTIVGNSIRRTDAGVLQYRGFNNIDDEARSTWVNFGSGNTNPTPQTSGLGGTTVGNTNSYTTNGVTNLYLVYSDDASGGSGGGDDDDDPDIGEIGSSKNVESNGDGTYKLTLSVTGSAARKETNPDVNVIYVLDTSSSMNRDERPWFVNTKRQLNQMVADLGEYNTTENPDAVEFSLVWFNHTSDIVTFSNGKTWTTDPAVFKAALGEGNNDGLTTNRGTNWALAMQKAIANTGDDDPTYVIFLTDGAPSQYWPDDVVFYSDGEGCYLGARDEARQLVSTGKVFYGIFAYSDDDRGYLEELVNYAYQDNGAAATYYADAKDVDKIQEKLDEILEAIKMNFAYAEVEIDDGITGMTSSTVFESDPESFNYEITYKDYTSATAYTTKKVNITVNGSGNNQTITIPSVTYGVSDGKTRTEVTTDEVVIKGAEARQNASGKSVVWDLEKTDGSLYMLEQAWTYQVDCKIWPSQPSYDIVAALNNELVNWGDDYTYTDDTGEHTILASDYMPQIMPPHTEGNDSDAYVLKTNTHASVSYQKYKAKITDEGVVYEKIGDPEDAPIKFQGGMPLDGEKFLLEKEWHTSLSPEEMAKIQSVNMYILEDNPTGIGFDKDDPDTYYKMVTLKKENGWKAHVAIAPGVWDGTKFRTTGHTYSVLEPDVDPHYEFSMTPIHPMLDGRTKTDITDMVDTYGKASAAEYKTMDRDEEQASIYKVDNTLKGGINIYKAIEVPDDLKPYVDEDQLFSFTIKLTDDNGDPVYTGEGGHDESGELGWRYFKEGSTEPEKGSIPQSGEVTLTMKASEFLRIANIPSGTYFTVEEGELSATEYEFVKSNYLARRHPTGSDAWQEIDSEEITSSRTTNQHAVYSNAENNVTFTNKYIGTGYTATKIWDDDGYTNRPKTITLQLYQKVKGSEEEAIPFKDPVVAGLDSEGNPLEGTTVDEQDPNKWYYTWKGLPLKQKVDEQVVEFEYSFEEINVDESYFVTMSDDGTTVTNTLRKKIQFIKKVMGADDPLEGAVFTAVVGDKTYTMTSNAKGELVTQDGTSILYLPYGENVCTLTETSVPEGFKKLTQDVKVSVRNSSSGISVVYLYQYASDPVTTWTDTDGYPVYVVTIRNSAGDELPFTGGPGTFIYTLSGLALIMATALMYGFRMRRRERRLN